VRNLICEPYEDRVTTLACSYCTKQRIRCFPKVKWAQEEEAELKEMKAEAQKSQPDLPKQSRQLKGKGKKRNAAGAYPFSSQLICVNHSCLDTVDNLTLIIESLQTDIRNESSQLQTDFQGEISQLCSDFWKVIGEACKDFMDVCTFLYNQDQMLHGMCKQSGVCLSSLNLQIQPATVTTVATVATIEEQAASTPSASSAVSNISSTSLGLHLGSLTLDSLTTCATNLPVAGPSGLSHKPNSGPSKLFYMSINFLTN
jgi:hypothetical protein